MPTDDYITIVAHLVVATIAGALIGYERSYQGRPAGFRTHTLVCIASALLMLLAIYQDTWFSASAEVVRVDPTRMAQGIMTGIGFLGAGVIVKEGASVRGLTTAASIWITAAIGILAGAGFYFGVAVGTVLTLGTLSAFRWIEDRMRVITYLQNTVRFPLQRAIPEAEYREFMAGHGFKTSEFSYRVNVESGYVEYHLVLSTRDPGAERRLAGALKKLPDVLEFRLAPSGD
ncbi:MAG TPA: MgtC/SapB family protein [Burkholderiales bacterium]|nr:MgtC/SapB family protein [Burkholderiales bacterium]